MQVILLEDLKTLGKKGEIVKVNDGYARNCIIPKKLGIEATPKNLNDLKLKKANDEKVALQILEEAKQFAETLKDKMVVVKLKSGNDGKTFGSISTKEIAHAIKEQLGYDIEKKKMQLDVPIKALGNYTVSIKLHQKVTAQLTVKVQEL